MLEDLVDELPAVLARAEHHDVTDQSSSGLPAVDAPIEQQADHEQAKQAIDEPEANPNP